MSKPVALITGGASGMGLAVTQRLVQLDWRVSIVDYNQTLGEQVSHQLGPQTIYIHADVADYEAQSRAFVMTWKKWGRLDLVFANAGFGDKLNFYAAAPDREDGSPAKPDMAVVDVCLNAMIYSAYLGLHYFRKNEKKSVGKIVFTSSMCGLYPGEGIPLYTASKHGIVGLVRAMSKRLQILKEPVTVNCICPGLVDTGLTGRLIAVTPQEYVTPTSTIVRAVEGFINDDSLNGQAAECSVNSIHFRKQPEWGDKEAEYIMTHPYESRVEENDFEKVFEK